VVNAVVKWGAPIMANSHNFRDALESIAAVISAHADALTTHIYDEDNGETVPQAEYDAIAAARAAITTIEAERGTMTAEILSQQGALDRCNEQIGELRLELERTEQQRREAVAVAAQNAQQTQVALEAAARTAEKLTKRDSLLRRLITTAEAMRCNEDAAFGEGGQSWEDDDLDRREVFYTYDGVVRSSDYLFFLHLPDVAALVDEAKLLLDGGSHAEG
jgi:septal ring factor EnvC (AmiA/AmiB activator)